MEWVLLGGCDADLYGLGVGHPTGEGKWLYSTRYRSSGVVMLQEVHVSFMHGSWIEWRGSKMPPFQCHAHSFLATSAAAATGAAVNDHPEMHYGVRTLFLGISLLPLCTLALMQYRCLFF